MTDTEAIALRANSARERHVECRCRRSTMAHCRLCGVTVSWPCDAASLAADIPELLARVRELEGALQEIVGLPCVVPDHPHGGVHPPYLEWKRVAALARDVLEPKP